MQSFGSVDEIQQWAIDEVLSKGRRVLPRGLPTLEIIGARITLVSPRRRCVTLSARRWSFPLALGEFCWHVAARDDVDSLAYYASRWREFSDDGVRIFGSCYGQRIFQHSERLPSQWSRAKDLLECDPDSRRVVLNFQDDQTALSANSKDVACASTMQFLIRNGKVDAVVSMRSNDVILGLPYDVFIFTMLQELFAAELSLEVGQYHHMVGSLHLYDRDLTIAKRVLADQSHSRFEMPRMESPTNLAKFLEIEAKLRRGSVVEDYNDLSPYWSDLVDVLNLFRMSKVGDRSTAAHRSSKSPYALLMHLAEKGSS